MGITGAPIKYWGFSVSALFAVYYVEESAVQNKNNFYFRGFLNSATRRKICCGLTVSGGLAFREELVKRNTGVLLLSTRFTICVIIK
jgi:hypothetical protein